MHCHFPHSICSHTSHYIIPNGHFFSQVGFFRQLTHVMASNYCNGFHPSSDATHEKYVTSIPEWGGVEELHSWSNMHRDIIISTDDECGVKNFQHKSKHWIFNCYGHQVKKLHVPEGIYDSPWSVVWNRVSLIYVHSSVHDNMYQYMYRCRYTLYLYRNTNSITQECMLLQDSRLI